MTPPKKEDETGSDYGGPRLSMHKWVMSAKDLFTISAVLFALLIGVFNFKQVNESQQQAGRTQTLSDRQFERLNDKVDSLQTKVSSLQDTVTSQNKSTEEIARLNEEITELRTEIKQQQVAQAEQQRTQIRDTIINSRNVPRVNNIDFSVNVGTVVPRQIHLAPVPETLVRIQPKWRGLVYFVYNDEIVIVDPHTMRIIAVVPA